MKLSFAALKRWLDYDDSANACADDLASLGFPNDGIREIGAALDEVVLAKILKMEKHPQADRLWLLEVDTGKEKLPVVCGAKNMKVSDFVAFAPVGANLPTEDGGGFRIKKAKIRGVESQGMCCSEAEVGLAEESEGIWILPTRAVEASKAALGTKLSELFPWRDTVFELDVTPNRGDALSLRGIARELAAKCSLKLKTQRTARWKQGSSVVNPRVESFEDAQGFLGVLIEGVSLDETPDEWRRFLVAMGGRPLSPLVDVSNILLFEMGHPIHLFDADRVDAKTIGVRRAKPGETLELLNDETIELSAEDLVIADQSGPLSLAGVMGGKASAVTSETTRVLLEVACFDAKRIRATSRRHQLFSESSFRFERQLTAHRLDEIADRCLGLIQEMGGSFESASGNKSLSR
ncbi:MAG: phenylalanine--tRNA ligase subunit beta, partial [Bradymonadales bacterium]